jgi:RNA polymerase sigma-70 factor, ECF subfamily
MIRWPWDLSGKTSQTASSPPAVPEGGEATPGRALTSAAERTSDAQRRSPFRPSATGPGEERRRAFERLAAEQATDLYAAALRLARNSDDAQDLTQDTLVRAYIAFDSFERGTNFRAWLLRILTNSYINLYRRRQRVAFAPWDDLTDMNESGPEPTWGARPAEPEAALLARAMDGEIEAALARLSEGVRLTLLLVDVEELSYEEAAAALEVPVGTIRSRLNRGREQMRRFLEEYARERRLA